MSLVNQQIELEKDTVAEALSRQRAQDASAAKRKEQSSTRLGTYFVRKSTLAMLTQLEEFLNRKGPGKKHIAAKLLKETELEPEIICYLTAKAVFNLFSGVIRGNKPVKRMTLIWMIAEHVLDEYRIRYFNEDKNRKALLTKIMKDMDKRTYPRPWRKRTIKMQFDACLMDWDVWSDDQKKHIGAALLHIFIEKTGVLEFVDAQNRIQPTEAFIHAAEIAAKSQTKDFMLYKPMLVPPYDWTDGSDGKRANLFRGGYISNDVRPYSIVKMAGRRDVERFMQMDWSKILPAINALQRTPWRINTVMVEALDWAFNVYSTTEQCPLKGIGKMARSVPEELPEEPEGYRDANGNIVESDIKRQHNHKVFLIHDRNRQNKAKRLQVITNLSAAKMFSKFERFYFPYDLDSRGRAYPRPGVLSPQGADFVKGLLEFADGVAIKDKVGEDWLAIAGANAYGNDKVSLAERVQWVHDNEDMILRIAEDYTSNLEWTHVSEPFCFLRFCLEWSNYRSQGYGYVSHMVVPVDATCSGLQHYAAMLRDEIGGKSVNLVPGFSRQDIYGDVAKLTVAKLQAEGSPEALNWIAVGIDRKMTKRQVMVVPYAAKFKSCMDYTRDAATEKFAEKPAPWDTSDSDVNNQHITLLSKVIWESITDVVLKGREAMQWLSSTGRAVAKAKNAATVTHVYERRMSWTTPDGFEVTHFREDEEKYQFKTMLDGRVDIVSYRGTGALKVSDMSTAIAPNFVHALDANLMRATVIRALTLGITSFHMIHDSFGVHAGHMAQFLDDAIKPAFVQMYEENDVLNQLRDTLLPIVPDLPEPPTKGNLDLQGVLRSEFFFS